MKNIKKAAVGFALGMVVLSAQAQSVHDASQASALSAAGLSAAVAFVPLSVAIGGAQFSALTMEHFSRLLAEETEWIVQQVTGKGPRTELQLKAAKSPTVVVVGVPTATVVKHHVRVETQVRFEQLGTQTYALMQGEHTLGVAAPADGHMSHSVKK